MRLRRRNRPTENERLLAEANAARLPPSRSLRGPMRPTLPRVSSSHITAGSITADKIVSGAITMSQFGIERKDV